LKTTPREAEAGGTGVNFTAMRNILKDPNATEQQQLDTWMQGFDSKKLGADWVKQLMDVARQNMGIQQAPAPTESLDEQFEMVWREYLTEAISPEEAVRSIVSTADSITKVYGDLKTMAEKWVYNNGTLKGFHRNAAGVGKRWYDTFFWNKMDNDLRLLMTENPKAAGKLRDFFDIERDDKGHISFTTIGRSLPRILNHVGEQMNNKDLKRFAAEWFRKHKDYEDYLGRVEAEVNDEDEDDYIPAPKQPKDNVVGRQNAAAEDMVNQILRSIDKKVAGEIRNAIAREPNKLQALQRELAKRNIKVGEGINEAPIEMDPADPMDPMIHSYQGANPAKLKYRMARAAGQLKDLASRVDGASPEEWKRMAQQFEELKMNMEQIRHALEELGKIRKKGGIRSRGITV
jgi:hypothetical protein